MFHVEQFSDAERECSTWSNWIALRRAMECSTRNNGWRGWRILDVKWICWKCCGDLHLQLQRIWMVCVSMPHAVSTFICGALERALQPSSLVGGSGVDQGSMEEADE